MDYSKMSDFEINKAVAESVFIDREGLEVVRSMPARNEITVFADKKGELVCIAAADYCNNAADAWPIIAENGISLIKCTVGSGYWSAEIITDIDEVTDKIFQCQSSFDYQDAKSLRAAMIVYLQLKEAK